MDGPTAMGRLVTLIETAALAYGIASVLALVVAGVVAWMIFRWNREADRDFRAMRDEHRRRFDQTARRIDRDRGGQ